MQAADMIYNPNAGRFPSGILAERAADVLRANGWSIRLIRTQDAEHVTQLARRAAEEGKEALVRRRWRWHNQPGGAWASWQRNCIGCITGGNSECPGSGAWSTGVNLDPLDGIGRKCTQVGKCNCHGRWILGSVQVPHF